MTKTKFDPDLKGKAVKSVMAKPNIIFCARAECMGKNGIIISFHKNYADYPDFVSRYRVEWGDVIESYDTILVSLSGVIIKPFSLKYLTELGEK